MEFAIDPDIERLPTFGPNENEVTLSKARSRL